MSRKTITTYYIESGDLTEKVEAATVEEACKVAIKQTNPRSLGRLMRISAREFMSDERDPDPWYISTEAVLESMGRLAKEQK